MAYFRCGVAPGHGGDGADLIVTCSQNFAGKTITCTDGNKTYTQQCPSSSPYEVTFESIPTGTWTISGVISGQTISTTKTITDFTATLAAIPDGATVTPTDVIQTWLHCANIWDKAYTSISQVLADTTTLNALIQNANAVKYMVRSTTWASSVTANQTAMTYIGANNNCSDSLLANSTWRNAICNSTYFESVLTTKVPTMTSDTAPSGVASASSNYATLNPFKAFDGSDAAFSRWLANTDAPAWIAYQFTSSIKVYKAHVYGFNTSNDEGWPKAFTIQKYVNGSWVDLTSYTESGSDGVDVNLVFANTGASSNQYRMYITTRAGNGPYVGCITLQFWGRA